MLTIIADHPFSCQKRADQVIRLRVILFPGKGRGFRRLFDEKIPAVDRIARVAHLHGSDANGV